MIPALNSVTAGEATGLINNTNTLNDVQNGTTINDISSQMNGVQSNYLDAFSNAIDDASSSYDFLNSVMQTHNPNQTVSTQEALHIQNEVEQFNVATQLVGKTVSIAVKDVDSLVRLQ